MANVAPVMPSNVPPTRKSLYVEAKASMTIGITAAKQAAENTLCPPRRSVKVPNGIRAKDPTRTGTARSTESLIGSNDNSVAIFKPKGPKSDHAQKLTVRASVARISALRGEDVHV